MAPVEIIRSAFQSIDYPHTLSTLVVGILSLPLIYYSCIAVYNVYFHPLASYPGPKIAAASSLWYARSLTRGTLALEFVELHKKYGPVVRVAPDELSYVDPGVFKEIYGHKRGGQPELEKDPKYHTGFRMEPTILSAGRQHHSEIRKLMSHGFSDGALRAQEPIIQENIRLLMRRLGENSQGGQAPLDMVNWYNFFTFDVIGYLTYGETFDCLNSSNLHSWISVMFSSLIQMALTQAMQRLPRALQWPYAKIFISESVKAQAKAQKDLSQEKVNARLKTPATVPDFMEKLTDAYRGGKMSSNQLTGNSIVLIAAGSETTATLLAGLTFLLVTHPNVQRRLAKEIRDTFSSPDEMTVTGVNGCKYLLACIEEALRIYPPSPQTHPRYVPSDGMMIAGQFVPGNVAVGISIYAAARSERNFHEADKFIPERWMHEDPIYADDKREALQPFSYGPRNCIGRNLAYVEMKLVIANILWAFDMENAEQGNWLDQRIYIVWDKRPLMVKLHPVRD
ncbi:averantin oxidoreductase [Xylariales sp. AK1849]|nr:averantin oxidoreductase [Xylariales sp. AK1849]